MNKSRFKHLVKGSDCLCRVNIYEDHPTHDQYVGLSGRWIFMSTATPIVRQLYKPQKQHFIHDKEKVEASLQVHLKMFQEWLNEFQPVTLMTDEEKQRLADICYRGKKGTYISSEDHLFAIQMFNEHREEYSSIQEPASKQAVDDYLCGL